MIKKSLQTAAKQYLAAYQQDVNYLTQRTQQQLKLIKQAAVSEIAKEGPQANLYKGL